MFKEKRLKGRCITVPLAASSNRHTTNFLVIYLIYLVYHHGVRLHRRGVLADHQIRRIHYHC